MREHIFCRQVLALLTYLQLSSGLESSNTNDVLIAHFTANISLALIVILEGGLPFYVMFGTRHRYVHRVQGDMKKHFRNDNKPQSIDKKEDSTPHNDSKTSLSSVLENEEWRGSLLRYLQRNLHLKA